MSRLVRYYVHADDVERIERWAKSNFVKNDVGRYTFAHALTEYLKLCEVKI